MKTHLNLLPHRVLCRQAILARLRLWLAVAAIAFVASLVCGWQLAQSSFAARRERDQLEEQYWPITRAQVEIRQMRGEIARLRQEQVIMLSLASDEPALPLIGLVSQAARDSESEVAVQKLSYQENAAKHTLSVQGSAKSMLAIARFAARLRDSKAFASVDLKSTEVETSDARASHRYHLECVF